MHVELVGAGRFDCGQDHRQILGLGSGKDSVDGDLFDCDLVQIRGHDGNDLIGLTGRALQHAQYPSFGRRNDG
ncbi:MAG: hypothetical protein GY773_28125 [Actinomycetia bacterium]|nr:hypothetical protein [Actinomycetes bacterium]